MLCSIKRNSPLYYEEIFFIYELNLFLGCWSYFLFIDVIIPEIKKTNAYDVFQLTPLETYSWSIFVLYDCWYKTLISSTGSDLSTDIEKSLWSNFYIIKWKLIYENVHLIWFGDTLFLNSYQLTLIGKKLTTTINTTENSANVSASYHWPTTAMAAFHLGTLFCEKKMI